MWRIAIGILLILHGLIHLGAASAPVPGREDEGAFRFFMGEGRSWLLRGMGASDSTSWWIALGLVIAATIGFVAAGVVLLAGIPGWRVLTIASAAISLVLLVFYWNRYLPIGVAVNAGLILMLVWAHWPGDELLDTS